jgi:PAS domain S-box-containing protein
MADLSAWPVLNRISGRAAVLIGVALIVISGLSLLILERRTDDRRDWVDHTYQIIMTLRGVDFLISEAEVGERGYLLTGDQAFLDPHDASLGNIRLHIKELEALVRDNPLQVERAAILEGAVVRKFGKMEDAIRGYRAGNLATVLETLRPRGTPDPIVTIRDISAAMERAELDLLRIRHEEAAKSDAYATVATLAVLIIALVVVFLGARQTARLRKERQEAARQVRENERRYRLLADHATDVIVLTDHDKAVPSYISPACKTVLGYDAGAPLNPDMLIHPDDAAAFAAEAAGLGPARPAVIIVCRMRKQDGAYIWVEVRARYVPASADQPASIVSNWRDITQRRTAELEAKTAREAAEAANRAKSDFLAMMSHELRTPMTGVLGMADLLLMSELSPDQAQMTHQLSRSAKALLEILNDILDFSKIEAGKLELETIAFRLSDIVADVRHLFAPQAAAKGIGFAVESAPGLHDTLMGDPKRVRQVVVNLVNNALKFTSEGGVTIAIKQDWITARRTLVILAVTDTGIGIPREIIDRLFQPFMQADASTARKYGGTGLGLTICRQLVAAMGGELSLESSPGAGSTFTLRIPMDVSDLPVAAAAPARTAPPAARPLKLLLAEDTDTTRDLMAAMMRRFGHAIDTAENGAVALEQAKSRDYDLILMDMQMPVMDGMQASAAIRALPGAAGRVPIIALTADAMTEHHARYLAAGADMVVTKPVDWSELNAAFVALAQAGASPAAPTAPDSANPVHELADLILDDSVLAALEEALGKETLAPLLASFADSLVNYRTRLRETVAAGPAEIDVKAAKKIAHGLRGLSAQFGAHGINAAATRIETETLSSEELTGLAERIVTLSDAVLTELGKRKLHPA